jgi:hypothetical protein
MFCTLHLSVVLCFPRWLIANGQYEEAQKLVMKAAKINKATISQGTLTHTANKVAR